MASALTVEQLTALRDAIENRTPYCSGVCAIPPEQFTVYYSNEEDTFRVDLSKANAKQLKLLSEACSPATFGRDDKDVLDESYRKAAKLDTSQFATNFNPDRAGLLNVIRSELLDGVDGTRPISAELYKLNVYGKGSFFKAHKDTPRSENMFGSLVIVYPTKHKGGELVFRHGENEWTFDSASEVASAPKHYVGYAAFFSDVEHEVLKVASGNRITLTYNLYFGKSDVPSNSELASASTAVANTSTFQETLAGLLIDAAFLPKGGYLGFGLSHQYPFGKTRGEKFPKHAAEYLKGGDATILHVARTLGLEASLRILYDPKCASYDDDESKLLTDHFVQLEYSDYGLINDMKSKGDIVVRRRPDDKGDEEDGQIVNWVTEVTSFNTVNQPFVTYGNEPSLDCVYGDFCLLVRVGPPTHRASAAAA